MIDDIKVGDHFISDLDGKLYVCTHIFDRTELDGVKQIGRSIYGKDYNGIITHVFNWEYTKVISHDHSK